MENGAFGGTRGDPDPVSSVPLDYSRALGGPGFELNPLGIGRETTEMPQLELPSHRVDGREARVAPAAFAPIPRTWAQRAAKTGSYGGGWTQERWPWLPDDFDYSYFNAAPASQWLGQEFRGDEELLFEIFTRSFRISDASAWSAGAMFHHARRGKPIRAPRPLEEIGMTLDTLCVDMDRELLTQVWRGGVRCAPSSYPTSTG